MNFGKILDKLSDFFIDICKLIIAGVLISEAVKSVGEENVLSLSLNFALLAFVVGFILLVISSIGGKK